MRLRAFPMIPFPLMLLALASLAAAATVEKASPPERAAMRNTEIPISFEANRGQTDPRVRFVARAAGHDVFVTEDAVVLALRGGPQPASLQLRVAGAGPARAVDGREALATRSHYLIGSDRTRWHTDVPHYAGVVQRGVRAGVDVEVRATAGHLEYDLLLAPGIDPASVAIDLDGADAIALDPDQSLRITTPAGDVVQHAPFAYQQIAGERRAVEAAWRIEGPRRVAFAIGAHDPRVALVIDPVVVYATYLGAAAADAVQGVAVDASGSAYLTGVTASLAFPTAVPFQPSLAGNEDAFVAKLAPDGGSLLYSTYYGGSSREVSLGIAIDALGSAHIVGSTASADLPTANAQQPIPASILDAWIAKFTPDGSGLVYATFLGGNASDSARSVGVDAAGNATVVGEVGSSDFPVLNAAQPTFQGIFDAFITSYDPAGALRWSTYLGGVGQEIARAVAVEPDGTVHVGGQTQSCNFPTLAPAQASCGGLADGFVTTYDNTGAVLFSTYLGGAGDDYVFAVGTDRIGSTYVTGRTGSANFPVLHALQPIKAVSADAYVTKLAPGGALLYSTFLGGNAPDDFTTIAELFRNGGIAADAGASAFVTGVTQSTDFPLAHPLQAALAGPSDITVARLTPDGQMLAYASYFGGASRDAARAIAVDAAGAAIVVGDTDSTDFPITPLALQTSASVAPDGFVLKISGTPACANGIDDDGDGAVDFPNDAGCESAASLVEIRPATTASTTTATATSTTSTIRSAMPRGTSPSLRIAATASTTTAMRWWTLPIRPVRRPARCAKAPSAKQTRRRRRRQDRLRRRRELEQGRSDRGGRSAMLGRLPQQGDAEQRLRPRRRDRVALRHRARRAPRDSERETQPRELASAAVPNPQRQSMTP